MQIEKVVFLKNYIIELVLNNGYKFFYDFKPQLHTIRFGKINSHERFEQGQLQDACRIVWSNEEKLEDYELFGYEIFESDLYANSNNKYSMCCKEAV